MHSEPAAAISQTAGELSRSPARGFGLRPVELGTVGAASLFVLLASYRAWWSIGIAEAWAFVTGGGRARICRYAKAWSKPAIFHLKSANSNRPYS